MKRKLNKKKVFIFIILPLITLIAFIFLFVFKNISSHAFSSSYENFENTNNNIIQDNSSQDIYLNAIVVAIDDNYEEIMDNLDKLNNKISYIETGDLELPVIGATGYASVSMPLKLSSSYDSETIKTLSAGKGFEIIKEDNNWWQVKVDNLQGWVDTTYCMINLPDVIPSIIYNNTNSYASMFKSSGKNLDGITGNVLYNAKSKNSRLDKEEYMMPVIYSMAKKICIAQQIALQEGNCLMIYESFRPYSVQKTVANSLTNLMDLDEEVKNNIRTGNWNESWFIAQSISNHQRGVAIDVSIVKVKDTSIKETGNYIYTNVTKYEQYKMPTDMHELSIKAATFNYPVPALSPTAWKTASLTSTMNNSAILLQKYCTSAGLTPLASEWWHFDDLDSRNATNDNSSYGKYFITECYSSIPTKID